MNSLREPGGWQPLPVPEFPKVSNRRAPNTLEAFGGGERHPSPNAHGRRAPGWWVSGCLGVWVSGCRIRRPFRRYDSKIAKTQRSSWWSLRKGSSLGIFLQLKANLVSVQDLSSGTGRLCWDDLTSICRQFFGGLRGPPENPIRGWFQREGRVSCFARPFFRLLAPILNQCRGSFLI